MENDRGQIYNRSRAKQIVNFNGLIYGSITPTDIDGHIDFHNKCAVWLELKYLNTPLKHGQRQALERAVTNSRIPSICIIGEHDLQPENDIPAHLCKMREYFYKGKWHIPKEQYTIKRMTDEFVGKHAPECLHLGAKLDSNAIMV
jgi:hypothetical protein